MTTIDQAAVEALQRPEDLGTWDEKDRLWTTHGPVAAVHRDSEALDRANWKAWQHELSEWTGGDDPDVFEAEFGHWAVGWIKHLFVRVYNDVSCEDCGGRGYIMEMALGESGVIHGEDECLTCGGNGTTQEFTPAFLKAFELIELLESYPVLDDDVLQEEEHEDLVSALKNYLDIPEERVEEAIQWLWNEHEVSYFEETTDEIIEELKALFVPDVTTD